MTREELETRAAEIDGMARDGLSTEELEKLAEEREGITRQLAELRMQAAQKAETRDRVANDQDAKVKAKAPEDTEKKEEKRMYNASSPEYRSAFLKMLQSTKADNSDVELTADDLKPDAPLFGDGVGLDSIDALEIGAALRRKYKVSFKANAEENRERFKTIASLAAFIAQSANIELED